MWLVCGMDALVADVLEDVLDVAPVVESAIAPDFAPALAAACIAS